MVEDLKGKLKDLEALNEELTQSNKTLHRQVDNLEGAKEEGERFKKLFLLPPT